MEVHCPNCNSKKTLRITDELRGKKVSFLCKTKDCGEKITVSIPKSSDLKTERKTVILDTKIGYKNAFVLHVDDAGDVIQSHPLAAGNNIIGRSAQNSMADIAIQTKDKYMSRSHCTISVLSEETGNNYILKDYQSKNDTFVNGQLLQKSEEIYLQNGDIIQMGKTSLKIQIH